MLEEKVAISEENNLQLRDILFIFGTYILSQLVASFLLSSVTSFSNDPNSYGNILLLLLTFTQAIGLIVVAVYLKERDIRLFKRKTPLKRLEPLFLLIAIPLFVFIVSGVFSYILGYTETGTTANQQALETTVSTAEFLPTLLAIGVIAPIFEELVFSKLKPLFCEGSL